MGVPLEETAKLLPAWAALLLGTLVVAAVLWVVWHPDWPSRLVVFTGACAVSSVLLWLLGMSQGSTTLAFCAIFCAAVLTRWVYELICTRRKGGL